jgi:hypothetical protein
VSFLSFYFVHSMFEISEHLRTKIDFKYDLNDGTKRLLEIRNSDIFSKLNICNSRRARRPLCKSKTSRRKFMISFLDNVLCNGLQEGISGFGFPKF